jgi:hypothetical protein
MRYISKIWVGLLAGCLLLATAGLCLGADATAPAGPPDGKQPPAPPTVGRMKEDLGKRLEQLVTGKVITEKQKTYVVEYYGVLFTKLVGQDPRKMMKNLDQLKKDGKDPLSLLVQDGVLNQGQAEAVDRLFPPKPPGPPGKGPGGNQPPPTLLSNMAATRNLLKVLNGNFRVVVWQEKMGDEEASG